MRPMRVADGFAAVGAPPDFVDEEQVPARARCVPKLVRFELIGNGRPFDVVPPLPADSHKFPFAAIAILVRCRRQPRKQVEEVFCRRGAYHGSSPATASASITSPMVSTFGWIPVCA